MRYGLAVLTLVAALTLAASAGMATGLHDFSPAPVQEPQQGVTLVPADDSASVTSPIDLQPSQIDPARDANIEGGQ